MTHPEATDPLAETYARLDHYLNGPPSRRSWCEIVELLVYWEHDVASLEAAVAYVDARLDHWPDDMRRVLCWYLYAHEPTRDRFGPILPLGRTITLTDRALDDDLFELLASNDPRMDPYIGLSLDGCDLNHDRLRRLGREPWTRRLRSLNLRGDGLNGCCIDALFSGHGFPDLKDLSLFYNFDRVSAAALLDALTATARTPIQRLSLEGPDALHAHDLEPLVGPRSQRPLRGLTHLNLPMIDLDDAAAHALARAPWIGHITHLDLSYNALGPEGLRALLNSGLAANIVDLNLEHNPLNLAGLELLAQTSMPRLRKLDISETRNHGKSPNEAIARAIAAASWFDQLTELALFINHLRVETITLYLNQPNLTPFTKRRFIDPHRHSTLAGLAQVYGIPTESHDPKRLYALLLETLGIA